MIFTHKAHYKSPIGLIEITGNEAGILSLNFLEEVVDTFDVHPCLKECLKQIDEYFTKKRTGFTVKLQLQGTKFQKKVWQQLLKIPFGKTVSYLDVATWIGDKKATRAVGSANGKNKIAIIIPCHRVIGSNGKLTGYAGGLWRKEWLLRHENTI